MNAAGELFRTKDVSYRFADLVRFVLGDTVRALRAGEARGEKLVDHARRGMPPDLNDEGGDIPWDEDEGVFEACDVAVRVIDSCAADTTAIDGEAWLDFREASCALSGMVHTDGDISEWLDQTALSLEPEEAELTESTSDLQALLGIPDAWDKDVVRRTAQLFAAATTGPFAAAARAPPRWCATSASVRASAHRHQETGPLLARQQAYPPGRREARPPYRLAAHARRRRRRRAAGPTPR